MMKGTGILRLRHARVGCAAVCVGIHLLRLAEPGVAAPKAEPPTGPLVSVQMATFLGGAGDDEAADAAFAEDGIYFVASNAAQPLKVPTLRRFAA